MRTARAARGVAEVNPFVLWQPTKVAVHFDKDAMGIGVPDVFLEAEHL